MPSVADGPERGTDGFRREALPGVERRRVMIELRKLVNWQVDGHGEALLVTDWQFGHLAMSATRGTGQLFEARMRGLWLPVWIPPEGRDR
jgi:hypothetical protein